MRVRVYRGRRKYVPGDVLRQLNQIKTTHKLRTDADAFRFMSEASKSLNKDLLGHTLEYFKLKKKRRML